MSERTGGGAPTGLRGVRRVLAVAAASVVLLLLLIEIGLRVVPIGGYTRADLSPDLERLLEEVRTVGHPFLAYALRPNFHTEPDDPHGQKSHNEFGQRGKGVPKAKPEGVFRIVCLGGSSTYGNSPSSDEKTWPARLEYYLNLADLGQRVEVINGGAPGWSTFESSINLSFRMLEWSPDLVVVYHSINDVRCALWPDPVSDNAHWRAVWPRPIVSPGERLLEHSMTYLVWRKHFTDYLDRFDSINTWGIVGYDPDAVDPFYSGPDVPEQGFWNFQRNLVTIQAIAKAHGARVMFGTQACDRDDIQGASRENQLGGMDRMEQILRTVAVERGVMLVDARRKLEEHAAQVGKDAIFTGEVHLTDAGADRLAVIFAERVIQEKLVR